MKETEQRAWLERKLQAAGAEPVVYLVIPRGSQRSRKSGPHDGAGKPLGNQTHLAILFEGVLQVIDSDLLEAVLQQGIGSAKGFGFGLLSLAPYCG
jgi:CRISPR system Cascade subunit CasE